MRSLLSAALTSLMVAACAAPASGPQVAPVLAASSSDEPRLDTDTWLRTVADKNETEIHIRNKSPVAIVVTEVTLRTCVNTGVPCGTHRPLVRIEPGSARQVLRLRHGIGLAPASYRYSYRVEPADTERN